jgi:hypothetical protein
MASRQEEKEQRRLEREAAEAKDRAARARKKRLSMVLGGLAGIAVIAVAALLISGAIDTGGGGDGGDGPKQAKAPADVKLPEQQTSDLDDAVETSGCKLEHPKFEGAGHETKEFTPADYQSNPPTSGAHFPEWYDDGIYAPGDVPELGKLVHTLEHGRINIQYKPGTDAETVAQLEALVAEEPYHMVMYQNPTGMEAQVAATAWTQSLTCDRVTDKTWDAMRTFRDRYLDKAPERVP